jgi:hypothetical protein
MREPSKGSNEMQSVQSTLSVRHVSISDVVAIGEAVVIRKIGDRVGIPYLQTGCGC